MTKKKLFIIGFGNHIQKKIIPAIKNVGIIIDGIVSSNQDHSYPKFTIEDLLNNNNKNHNIIISGIPTNHYNILQKIKDSKAHILIEKPAFTDLNILQKNKKLFKNKKINEAMMYKFGLAFRYSKFVYNMEAKNVNFLSFKFKLPINIIELKKTFRYTANLKNSIIYDIGYYILDLLWSFDVKVISVDVKSISWFSESILKSILVDLECYNKGKYHKVSFDIGYGEKYFNQIEIYFSNKIHTISPFFWGREGDINFSIIKDGKTLDRNKNVKNSYEKMIKYWYNMSKNNTLSELNNFYRYEYILLHLNQIEEQVKINAR